MNIADIKKWESEKKRERERKGAEEKTRVRGKKTIKERRGKKRITRDVKLTFRVTLYRSASTNATKSFRSIFSDNTAFTPQSTDRHLFRNNSFCKCVFMRVFNLI